MLTKPFETFEKPGLVIAYKVSAATVYKGALCAVDTNGFLAILDEASPGLTFVGVAGETVDNSAGAAGDRTLNVTKSGTFVFKAAAGYVPSQADLGKEVYAKTDWEVQTSAVGLGTAYKVGRIVGLETTSTGASGVRVRIDDYTS